MQGTINPNEADRLLRNKYRIRRLRLAIAAASDPQVVERLTEELDRRLQQVSEFFEEVNHA